MTNYTFTPEELELVIEALNKSASRHESESRYNPGGRYRNMHDDKAEGMRKLSKKLLKYRQAEAA